MRSILMTLLSTVAATAVFAGGDSAPSVGKDIQRLQSELDGKKQLFAELQAEGSNKIYQETGHNLQQISESAKAGAEAAKQLESLKSRVGAIQVDAERISKQSSDMAADLKKVQKLERAAFNPYNRNLASLLVGAEKLTDQQQTEKLEKSFKLAQDAFLRLDMLGDLNQIKNESGDLALQAHMLMNQIDTTILGRYVRQRNSDLLQSKSFCEAVKFAAEKGACADKKDTFRNGYLSDSVDPKITNFFNEQRNDKAHGGKAVPQEQNE